MLSLFGLVALPIGFGTFSYCVSHYRFKEHFHTTLSMLFSSFFYSFLFNPESDQKQISNQVLDLGYLWIPNAKNGTLWLSVFHYCYVYMFIASFIKIVIFIKRLYISNYVSKIFVYLPAAIFSTFNLVSLVFVVVTRVLFVGQFPKNWIPFAIFSPIAMFCFFGYFQSLFVFESTFHAIIGVGKKKRKKKNNEQNDEIEYLQEQSLNPIKNSARRLSKAKARNLITQNRPNDSNCEWKELKIIQISDPHIGPFMSIKKFYNICKRTVERNPDLVFITGDVLTFETMNRKGVDGLSYALSPFQKMKGKVFACIGSTDYYYFEEIKEAFLKNDIIYLKNEESFVNLDHCKIQVVGIDNITGNAVTNVCKDLKPNANSDLRIIMLHDPKEFTHIPVNDNSLVLSGKTHGGIFGLNFLGIHSALSELATLTQNFYEKGSNLLYIHRGTGFHGWPMRTGSSGEQSMMHLHLLVNQNKTFNNVSYRSEFFSNNSFQESESLLSNQTHSSHFSSLSDN
ncbi:hypothetical protein M0812_10206 [Anaeramoeba flamelloides]|uniref:Calcineurin-like phosphoesterase domain-containing protein n=1 Tax=Anaeramoeba flamelloides TaxID=1746091 RepID=A0AAV7ZQT6_9EUKA|nr:hypothetical protein M0812_10206 [Anaeramoeba flamelloides]